MENSLATKDLLRKIVKKIKEEKDKSEIAAWFHVQLVLTVQQMASKHGCTKLCFSGGVFQNGLLVDITIKVLGKKYSLHFNKKLSPNDENISFGQLLWYKTKNEPINQKM